jgi:hypothetical protein
MKFVTWNFRILFRAGSLKEAARELARYKLDLVGVQEVGWNKEGTVRTGSYNFLPTEEKTKIINWEDDFLYTKE